MTNSDVQLRKVKRVAGRNGTEKLIVNYDRIVDDEDTDSFSLRSSDPAHPGLYLAMDALKSYVLKTCQVGDSWDEQEMEIPEVAFSYKDGRFAAQIAVKQRLDNFVLSFKLPKRRSFAEDDNCSFDPDTERVLRRLMQECERYINGDRPSPL